MQIKVMDDYGCWPLWVREERGGGFDTHDPAELGLSSSLVGRLEAWQRWSDSMVNIADPNDGRPISDTEHEALAAEGRRLAIRVADELPGVRVWYYEDPEPGPAFAASPLERAGCGLVAEEPDDASAVTAIPSATGVYGLPPITATSGGSRLRTMLSALASVVGKAAGQPDGDHRGPKDERDPDSG
jgi:hypothetical protein